MKPYCDPLRDQLSALERYTELSFARERDFGVDLEEIDELFEDGLARALGEAEESIERSLTPPADRTHAEPPLLPTPAAGPTLATHARREPPTLVEPAERPRVELMPPLAARPHFITNGIEFLPHPSGASAGTGIRNSGPSATTRWCPEDKKWVTEEACGGCQNWGDHGEGFEECKYDTEAKNETTRGETERAEDEE